MPPLREKDRENIIQLLQEGKPLPEMYKSTLFPSEDKEYAELTKVYQLVYQGKKRKEDVIAETLAAPLQEMRAFNMEHPFADGWRNMLIFGDNLMALKALYDDQRGPDKYGTKNRIKLIYIDPPFTTKQDFMKDREKAYRDKIIGAQFIEFLRKRLILLRGVLAEDGYIFVHVDSKKVHYIKAVMDEIFDEMNFRNEIILPRPFTKNLQQQFSSISSLNVRHDTLLFYTRKIDTDFPPLWVDKIEIKHQEGHWHHFWSNADRPTMRYELFGITPSTGQWIWKESKAREAVANYERYLKDADGRSLVQYWLDTGKSLRFIRKDDEGKPQSWRPPAAQQLADTLWLNLMTYENQKIYPTQKHEDLLGRLINSFSKGNNIVLDAFAGSGTTLAVAEKLGRRWIGMDCGKLAIYTIQKRLLNLTTRVGSAKKDERKLSERVEGFDNHIKTSKSLFLVTEKANKGELLIDNAFMEALHALVAATQKKGEFSLICPEEKFRIRSFEEDEDGRKIIEKDHITYVVSFVEPKEKLEKEKPLTARAFALFNAGIYDNEAILNLDWQAYRGFVLKLFEVREERHSINGFPVDGYIGADSAYIWDYPNCKTQTLDEGYVESLHRHLAGKAGDRFYVIAPVVSFSFLMDEIRLGETIYVFLKVPISVLTRLIERKSLGAFQQPCTEADVNEVIDAVGFDFISPPVVKAQYLRLPPETPDLLTKDRKDYVIRLKEFRSDTLASSPEDFENYETLSMVLIDFAFNGKVFDMDVVYWAEDLVNAELKRKVIMSTAKFSEKATECDYLDIRLPEEKATDSMMVIFIDKYGNEKKQVLKRKDFLKNARGDV